MTTLGSNSSGTASQSHVFHGVFTLEPDVIFAERIACPAQPADFPPEWQELHRRLTSVTAIYEAMIEDEKMHSDDGRQKAQSWAGSHHELAVYMRDHRTSREHARLNARGRLLGDLAKELAAVAQSAQIDDGEFRAWSTRACTTASARCLTSDASRRSSSIAYATRTIGGRATTFSIFTSSPARQVTPM
jgi:hypothetical protein